MGRSSEGSGHSRRCTLDATNDATPAPGRARQARGKFPIGGLRQACGKVPTPLHGVNHFVSWAQNYGDGSVAWSAPEGARHREMSKNWPVLKPMSLTTPR